MTLYVRGIVTFQEIRRISMHDAGRCASRTLCRAKQQYPKGLSLADGRRSPTFDGKRFSINHDYIYASLRVHLHWQKGNMVFTLLSTGQNG